MAAYRLWILTGLALAAGAAAPVGFGSVYDVAFAPDGAALAVCQGDGTLSLRDPITLEERKALRNHEAAVLAAAFSQDGKWVVSGGYDRTVRVWEAATGREVLRRRGHESPIRVGEVAFGADGRTAVSCSSDLTALVWDLRPPKPAGGTAAWWDDLASEDAARAYAAVWALADDPAAAALLRGKLSPASPPPDAGEVRRLVARLDDDHFEEREKAAKALAGMGRPVLPALKRAEKAGGSTETKRRLRELIAALTRPAGPEDFRRMRAVRAMELSGTPEARAVLRAWAGGAEGSPLADDAAAALARLGSRGAAGR